MFMFLESLILQTLGVFMYLTLKPHESLTEFPCLLNDFFSVALYIRQTLILYKHGSQLYKLAVLELSQPLFVFGRQHVLQSL